MDTILIVDDDVDLAECLSDLMTFHGYTTHIAQNGQQAWELLQQHAVDLLITDQNIPLVKGKQLIVNLRQEPHLAHIPIILMSGSVTPVDGIEFCDHIRKPFGIDELLRLINRITP